MTKIRSTNDTYLDIDFNKYRKKKWSKLSADERVLLTQVALTDLINGVEKLKAREIKKDSMRASQCISRFKEMVRRHLNTTRTT